MKRSTTTKTIKQEISEAVKYDVIIIETSPFKYKNVEYAIDETNIIHTYGNVAKGINSMPVGKWKSYK